MRRLRAQRRRRERRELMNRSECPEEEEYSVRDVEEAAMEERRREGEVALEMVPVGEIVEELSELDVGVELGTDWISEIQTSTV